MPYVNITSSTKIMIKSDKKVQRDTRIKHFLKNKYSSSLNLPQWFTTTSQTKLLRNPDIRRCFILIQGDDPNTYFKVLLWNTYAYALCMVQGIFTSYKVMLCTRLELVHIQTGSLIYIRANAKFCTCTHTHEKDVYSYLYSQPGTLHSYSLQCTHTTSLLCTKR